MVLLTYLLNLLACLLFIYLLTITGHTTVLLLLLLLARSYRKTVTNMLKESRVRNFFHGTYTVAQNLWYRPTLQRTTRTTVAGGTYPGGHGVRLGAAMV